MTHALGVYYAPEHNFKEDRDYIAALQPPVIRILDPDVQHIVDMHALVPNAVIAPRTWAIDDGSDESNPSKQVRRLMADPVGTGRDHAEQYKGQLDRWQNEARQRGLRFPPADRLMFNSANEPNQGGSPEKIAAYNVAFLNRCTELGIRAAALCLGVGWPDNSGPDTPVNWKPYADAGLVEAVKRGNHWLSLHEYFYKTGPQDNWRWWAGRHLQCPFDVPILLGEIGIDNYVDTARWGKDGGNRGWQGNVSPEQYADMILQHVQGCDKRVVAVLPFITDFRNNHWESFNTRAAHGALLARKEQMVPQAQKPQVGNGQMPVEKPKEMPVANGIIDPLVAEAILKIESGNSGFSNGKLKIRIEAHLLLHRDYGNPAVFAPFFRCEPKDYINGWYRTNANGEWIHYHNQGQAGEWAAFEFARSLDEAAALRCISMGAAQVMGFNCERIGYPTPKAMFRALSGSENAHVISFFNYCLGDAELMAAIQRKDWDTIARKYNGAGNVPKYSKLLRDAYAGLGG